MKNGLVLLFLLAGCAAGTPRPIVYGQENCAFCRMIVSDPRLGAEAVTGRGRVQTFDAVECLAAYYTANRPTIRSLWVTWPDHPGVLVPAETARYRRQGSTPGHAVVVDREGPLTWNDVVAQVEREAHTP